MAAVATKSPISIQLDPALADSGYAFPGALVSTDWLMANLNTPGVKVVEIDVDPKLYAAGHVPGAIGWDWSKDLQDPVRRDIPSRQAWEVLLSRSGIGPQDTIVFYGDASNWFASFGFWVAKIYGHADVRLLNGGRVKWLNESDKPFATDVPAPAPTSYRVTGENRSLRAALVDVLAIANKQAKANLVDVRSSDEFTGKLLAPPGLTETAQRAGHVPGATSIPWATSVNADGTFKSAAELREIYINTKGLDPERDTVAYCRIGERSSHTWFVLKYLLGLKNVRNYDGSWTEYGSVIGVPIEKSV
jgi:thiosulfate/3-mercaptopyruvate sulfurtransferase